MALLSLLTLAAALHFPAAMPIADAATMRTASGPYVNPGSVPPVAERNYSSVTWFRLHLDRGSSTNAWGLRYTYKVTRIDVYVPKPGGFAVTSGGFDLASKDGALVPGFLLLPEDALHDRTIYVRVASVVDPRSISIAPLRPVLAVALQRRAILGLSVGFYLTVGVFFILMFVGLRDRALADYAVVMGFQALQLLASFGTLWQLLPPLTFLQRELIFDGIAMASQIALVSFAIRFLNLGTRDVLARNIVLAGMVLWFGTIAVDFVQNAQLALVVTLVSNFGLQGALLYAGVRALQSVRGATFYIAAVIALIAGYALNESSPLMPWPDITVFGLQAGSIVASLLLALAVARHIQENETLAMRDGLTNVLNRRSFDAALVGLSTRAMRTAATLGVLLIDIDRFKQYNDRLGHLAGDDCLIAVARACAACVRADDVFARYGGEEFAAIVSAATQHDLQAIAARMMDAVTPLGVTISIGGTLLAQRAPADAQRLLQTADENLYSAKLSGRNRAVLA